MRSDLTARAPVRNPPISATTSGAGRTLSISAPLLHVRSQHFIL
ncbi:MAG: hypothetical protein AVDCRST_MAG27-410 [uncultured Craurococcus sp.]|uniref:Uncharacterized protein n=1 Tax=uncultured Craurococcus sp. TaxID=1135998 RepID=A0A6J4HGW8_9PROT|nr:MAG: hypothetical protein AVDCRST_MAG27-410 [uncultured Craurococcus sp.]